MIPIFCTRLRELRLGKNLKQEQVARMIKMNKRAVSAYEMGDRQPSFETLVVLARLFHVSTDYLLGLSDIRSLEIADLTDTEIGILNELAQIMAEKNRQLKNR